MASADPARGAAESDLEAASGVYVHLPFCSAICPYCDFAVTVGGSDLQRRLIAGVAAEVERVAGPGRRRVDTIYFGGGTPSLHGPEEIETVLVALRRVFDIDGEARIFLEANPEDVTPETVAQWKSLGVRTLSLGVQALDDEALAFLGRRHTAREARHSIESARAGGIDTVSVDLIYARPGQAEASWRRELEEVTALEPDHLSCYQLTVHRGTPFGRRLMRGSLAEMPDGEQSQLFLVTLRTLENLGYPAYEVSNFARHRRHRSAHNLKYWTGAPYFGFGPSAHSFDGERRWWNVASPRDYLERVEAGEPLREGEERLSPGQRLLEELMLGLRRPTGVELSALSGSYGLDLMRRNEARLERWQRDGWIRRDGGWIRPTPEGLLKADRLAASLDLGRLNPESLEPGPPRA